MDASFAHGAELALVSGAGKRSGAASRRPFGHTQPAQLQDALRASGPGGFFYRLARLVALGVPPFHAGTTALRFLSLIITGMPFFPKEVTPRA